MASFLSVQYKETIAAKKFYPVKSGKSVDELRSYADQLLDWMLRVMERSTKREYPKRWYDDEINATKEILAIVAEQLPEIK